MKKYQIGIILLLLLSLTFCSCNPYKILGVDESWVVSSDFQTITHNEEVYISIDQYEDVLENFEIGENPIEVKVTGDPVWGKLFFGDIIYFMVDEELSDIIYFFTDYDGEHPTYFCKESSYAEMCEFLEATKKQKDINDNVNQILISKERALEIASEYWDIQNGDMNSGPDYPFGFAIFQKPSSEAPYYRVVLR